MGQIPETGRKKGWWPSTHEVGEQVVVALLHPITAFISIGAILIGLFLFTPFAQGPSMCAFKTSTGLPCPGCGLTRSVTCILHGKFHGAWEYNPFGYGFTFFFLITAPMIFVRKRIKEKLGQKLRPLEKAFAYIFFSFVFGLLLFGMVRMAMVQLNLAPYKWWNNGEIPPSLIDEYPYGKKTVNKAEATETDSMSLESFSQGEINQEAKEEDPSSN